MGQVSASGTPTLAPSEAIYRRNFIFFLIDGILFTVALGMMGATTLIPDFVRNLTDQEIIIGVSSSIFSVGYTLPQLFVARFIIKHERKKMWFIIPNIPTRFVILLFAIFVWFQQDVQPALILVLFVSVYALAALGDGLVGVPWADLTGSSLDEKWRARLYGMIAAGGGLIMLAVTPLLASILSGEPGFPRNYALIFGMAGAIFAISILPVIFVKELTGGKPVESVPTFTEYFGKLTQILRSDRAYRHIIQAQMLTSLYLMAMPFYIGYATTQLGLSSETAVPVLFAMQTVGNILGALLYIWLGAHNNELYIRLALAGAALLPITALVAGITGPVPLYIGFLFSGAAVSNLMFGYQNWIITHAPAGERPVYIGLSNTVVAVVTLISPIIGGAIVQTSSYTLLFVVALVTVIGAVFTMGSIIKQKNILPI